MDNAQPGVQKASNGLGKQNEGDSTPRILDEKCSVISVTYCLPFILLSNASYTPTYLIFRVLGYFWLFCIGCHKRVN